MNNLPKPKQRFKRKKDFEILFYESLVSKRPNFVHALIPLGDAYTRKGFYQEGLEVDQRLTTLKPKDPVVHYNLACSLSLLGDVDASWIAFKKALEFGYDEFDHILQDPDLENLRQTPKFQEFFGRFKK